MEAAGYIGNNSVKDINAHQEYMINNSLGDRLRHLREEKGVTQKELGNFINVSDRVVGYYESS